jgi:AbiV family abortive infection protein
VKLARAALSNATDLLSDARVLADAGRFPRAYALATLACEELGKQQQCLRAVWLPCTGEGFWRGFTRHTAKLSHVQALTVFDSEEQISSPDIFNQRVRQQTRSAHQRKLRGLYVDYADGTTQLPGEIAEQETQQLIDRVQAALTNDTAEWAQRANMVQWLARQSPTARLLWVLFLIWVTEAETETLMSVLRSRDFANAAPDLLRRFLEHVGTPDRLLAQLHESLPVPCVVCFRG